MKKSSIIPILFILVALCMSSITIHADIVKGRVVDAETKEPLPEAQLTFNNLDDGWVWAYLKSDSLGCFSINARGRNTVTAEMLGYYSKTKTFLAFSDSRKDTLDLGDIELTMSSQMLKMVEVKGHARRFTVKGDTIVFHPEAFHLQEGARLDELIRQLPGVQVDENGKLSWNGKPIRITMGGQRLLGDDDIVGQLPAEAVQDIKAYNKQSTFSERTGKDDGTEDMVLDLTIKPGFLDRWYGDVTASVQSPQHYEGMMVMNRLSKTDPFLVFANANNTGVGHERNMHDWTIFMNGGKGYGIEQGLSTGYQHNWPKMMGTHNLENYYDVTGGLVHHDEWKTNNQITENYFPNTTATRSTSENYQRSHSLRPRIKAELEWSPDTLNTFYLKASVYHSKTHSHSSQTVEDEEMLAGTSVYAPTLSQLTSQRDEGHQTNLWSRGGWEHFVKDGSFGINYYIGSRENKTDSWTERTITSHTSSISSSQMSQYYTLPDKTFMTYGEAFFDHWLTQKWRMKTTYKLSFERNRRDCDFLTDGLVDDANSYQDHHTTLLHDFNISQTINIKTLQLMPNVSAQWQRERQDYTRGSLDTAAVRHSFQIDPSLRANWKISKTIGLNVNYSFKTKMPELLNTLAYRDLTNPLFIVEGNPHLKDTHTHDASLSYNMVLSKSQTSFNLTMSYRSSDREHISALSYDPTTAVYVSRTENVKGSQTWSFRLNLDQALGDYFRLQNNLEISTEQRYGYLTLLPTQTERTLNQQSSFHPKEKITLSFDHTWLKTSVFAEIDANRQRYDASPEQNTTLWNNRFGIKGEVTVGNFVFNTDLTESTRRGYNVQSMNKNLLLWNGSVSWKIFKNKARLGLEFEDILNNEDGFYESQTAYQRTTSWSDFRHHYIGLSFTYHLDAKSKDK